MTKPTLVELQKVLGSGIGLGLSASKPTKKNPFKGCIINDKLNSIELDDYIMDEYIRKPLMPYKGNGIDFIYTDESRQLSCNVRYSSLVVSNAEVATDRIPSADVCVWPASNAYVGAWFLYQGSVFEVERIDGKCCHMQRPR
jgi:hypothetical protein